MNDIARLNDITHYQSPAPIKKAMHYQKLANIKWKKQEHKRKRSKHLNNKHIDLKQARYRIYTYMNIFIYYIKHAEQI